MKRRRSQPDNRLDWRDPNMPVLRRFNADTFDTTEVKPEDIQRFYEHKLSDPHYNAPDYKNDETYDLRNGKRK